jgi:hypothetical protein
MNDCSRIAARKFKSPEIPGEKLEYRTFKCPAVRCNDFCFWTLVPFVASFVAPHRERIRNRFDSREVVDTAVSAPRKLGR